MKKMIIFVILFFFSCGFSNNSKIIGKWKNERFSSTSEQEMIFKRDGKVLNFTRYTNKYIIDAMGEEISDYSDQWSIKDDTLIMGAAIYSILHLDDKSLILKLTGYTHTEKAKKEMYEEYIKATKTNETFDEHWRKGIGTIDKYRRIE